MTFARPDGGCFLLLRDKTGIIIVHGLSRIGMVDDSIIESAGYEFSLLEQYYCYDIYFYVIINTLI